MVDEVIGFLHRLVFFWSKRKGEGGTKDAIMSVARLSLVEEEEEFLVDGLWRRRRFHYGLVGAGAG